MTDFLSCIHAVKVRNVGVGVAPRAVLVGLLNDSTEVAVDDADGTRWVLHYLDLHFLTFRYYDTTSAAEDFE
jgi:hypothetical protein